MAFTIQYRMKQFLAPFVIEPKMDLHFLKKIHSFNSDLYLIQVHVLALWPLQWQSLDFIYLPINLQQH